MHPEEYKNEEIFGKNVKRPLQTRDLADIIDANEFDPGQVSRSSQEESHNFSYLAWRDCMLEV